MSLKPEHLKRYKAVVAEAEELAADIEKLGPTVIKLGQLLSTRPDIVPPAHAQALARLQDDVAPFPLAAASIAQVHRATLRDGREVAMADIARFVVEHTRFDQRYNVDQLFEEFRKSLLRELDLAGARLQHLTRAHDGVHRRHQDHRAQPASW